MTNFTNNNTFAPITHEVSPFMTDLTLDCIIDDLHEGTSFAGTADAYFRTSERKLSRELKELASANASLINGGKTTLPIHWDGVDFELTAHLSADDDGCLDLFYFRWEPQDCSRYAEGQSFDDITASETPFGQLVEREEGSDRFWYQALYLPTLYTPEFFTAVLCGAIEETAYYIHRLEKECRI